MPIHRDGNGFSIQILPANRLHIAPVETLGKIKWQYFFAGNVSRQLYETSDEALAAGLRFCIGYFIGKQESVKIALENMDEYVAFIERPVL